jgi:hypothetical protein
MNNKERRYISSRPEIGAMRLARLRRGGHSRRQGTSPEKPGLLSLEGW